MRFDTNCPIDVFWQATCLRNSESVDVKALPISRHAVTVLPVPATFAIFLTIGFFYSKAKHPVVQVVAPTMSKDGSRNRPAAEAEPGRRLRCS